MRAAPCSDSQLASSAFDHRVSPLLASTAVNPVTPRPDRAWSLWARIDPDTASYANTDDGTGRSQTAAKLPNGCGLITARFVGESPDTVTTMPTASTAARPAAVRRAHRLVTAGRKRLRRGSVATS